MPGAPPPPPGLDLSAASGAGTGVGTSNPFADLIGTTDFVLNQPIYSQGQPITKNGQKVTIAQALYTFEGSPLSEREQIANMLVDKGFLTATSARDPISVLSAYQRLLHYATLDPAKDLQSTIDGLPSLGATGTTKVGGAKVHVTLTNPLDVQYTGNAVAQKLVGRNLSPQEALDIANTIRSQELASGTAEAQAEQSLLDAQAGGTGAGGVITSMQPTSVEAATQQYLATNQPGQYQGHALYDVFQAIQQKVANDAAKQPRALAGPVKL